MTTYGSKINYAIFKISHKGLACMLNTFMHTSFGLFFFLNVGLQNLHCNASK
jgi:hypothetical protein